MQWLRALGIRLHHQAGQTLAEYGVMVTVIAVAVILAAILFGSSVNSLFVSNAHGV